MSTWSDQIKQACDNGTPRKSRVDAIMDARRARIAGSKDEAFEKLEHSLAHKKGVENAPAAKVGREKLGQAERARRAEAGRKDSDDAGHER